MVWGGISHGLKSPLIVITGNLTDVRYRDEILRPVAVPFIQQHHLIFQQDNARPPQYFKVKSINSSISRMPALAHLLQL
jgi:hypothetical protein